MPSGANLREYRIERARRCARHIHHRYGVAAPEHIRLEAICAAHGVTILVTPLDGADAQLVRDGRHATILVSDRNSDPDKQRFDIAHELGHFLLGHHTHIHSAIPGPEAPRSSLEEHEANAFAAELLMPEQLVRAECNLSQIDLAGPRQIAFHYHVSLLTSAIRFIELAHEPCAAAFSIPNKSCGGRIKWVASSAPLRLTIRLGKPLSPDSLASRFYEIGTVADEPGDVPPGAWFDSPTADVRVIEHAVARPDLKTVLSMLWVQKRAP